MKIPATLTTTLSASGLATTLLLYLLTLLGISAPMFPYGFGVLLFSIIMWLLAILKLRKRAGATGLHFTVGPAKFWRIAFGGAPLWVKIVGIAGFLFGSASLFYHFHYHLGTVGIIDGEQVIHDRGIILQKLSDQEYIQAIAAETRSMLSVPLSFFSLSFAVLFPRVEEDEGE